MQKIVREKVILPFLNILKQGSDPKTLAQSITLGIVLGVMPILGVSTWLCTIIVLRFRLNMVSAQFINYLAYPLQILLFLPFLRLGSFLSQQPSLENMAIINMMQNAPLQTILTFGEVIFWGLLAWAFVMLPLSIMIYRLFYFICVKKEQFLPKKYQNLK